MTLFFKLVYKVFPHTVVLQNPNCWGGSFMKSNTFIVIFLLIWVVLQMYFANVKKVVSSKALRMSNVASPDHYWKSTEIPKLLNEYFKDRETSNMADM